MPATRNRRPVGLTPETALLFEEEWGPGQRGPNDGPYMRAVDERFRCSMVSYVIILNRALGDPALRDVAPHAFDALSAARDRRAAVRARRHFGSRGPRQEAA